MSFLLQIPLFLVFDGYIANRQKFFAEEQTFQNSPYTFLRSTLKQVQDTHEAETVELTRMKKELEIEREELRHRLAKTEMTITALQCENKVHKSPFTVAFSTRVCGFLVKVQSV